MTKSPIEQELQSLDDELDLELEMELENELLSMDEFDDDSDTSISSLTSSSLSSLTSTDSSLSSISSTDNSSNSSSDTELFDDEPEPDDYMDTLDQLLPLVLNQRYHVKRIPTLKSRDFVTRVLPQLNEYDFKEQYRMFHRSFFRILERIQDHPIFHTGTESRPQDSPQFQLQVALKTVWNRRGLSKLMVSNIQTIWHWKRHCWKLHKSCNDCFDEPLEPGCIMED